ncbi:MAG: hypothetical protein R3B70_37910 [Polyangiaceae bacterium]
MSLPDCPYLLVLVEGPSEAQASASIDGEGGIVRAIIAHVFGSEVARNIRVQYWRHTPRSPLRRAADGASHLRAGRQVRHAAILANATTVYGAVIVVDNDGLYQQGRPVRLEELREGVESSGVSEQVAYGVAQETVEAWILADPEIVSLPLPAGKTVEQLWGKRNDPGGNHPKHVLARAPWSQPDCLSATPLKPGA